MNEVIIIIFCYCHQKTSSRGLKNIWPQAWIPLQETSFLLYYPCFNSLGNRNIQKETLDNVAVVSHDNDEMRHKFLWEQDALDDFFPHLRSSTKACPRSPHLPVYYFSYYIFVSLLLVIILMECLTTIIEDNMHGTKMLKMNNELNCDIQSMKAT